jgi:hypothetical protein
LSTEPTDPAKIARDRLTNLLLLLISAIVLALVVSVLGGLIVIYIQTGVLFATPIVLSAMATFGLSYCLFYLYLFRPTSAIKRDVRVSIVYDTEERAIIPDPFDGYQPQGMAQLVFSRFKSESPEEASQRISEKPRIQDLTRFVFSDLMEFLLVSWLHGRLMGDGKGGLERDERKKLPAELNRNVFVSFFQKLEPKCPTDLAMRQLEPILPKDIKVRFESPFPFENVMDPNTFRLSLSGKYCDVQIGCLLTGITQVTGMVTGPSPSFEGVRIRVDSMEDLMQRFGHLGRVSFLIHIEARLKLRFGIRVKWAYLEWANGWIGALAGGRELEGFDFDSFARARTGAALGDIYDVVKDTNSMIRETRKQSKVKEATGNPDADEARNS